jgi:tetratricopeptide (TPR) repeat protein
VGLADRTNSLWQLFRADSPPGARLRRRVAAIAAMFVFLLALLATVGLLRIVLFAVAVVGLGAAVALVLLAVGPYGPQLVAFGRGAVRRIRSAASLLAAAVSRGTSGVARSGSRAAVATRRSAEARLPAWRDRYERAQATAGRRIAAATTQTKRHAHTARSQAPALRGRYVSLQSAAVRQLAGATTQTQRHVRAATSAVQARRDAWPTRTPAPVVQDRAALRANAAGAQLRRDGAYLQAAEQHRIALDLFRELGDRRSEALTLNNLALALDRAGEAGALELFEEAAAILGELGEDQQEGEVIANLALAFRRRGSDERSAEVLELALEKLNPESQAYRKVEGLRRAS